MAVHNYNYQEIIECLKQSVNEHPDYADVLGQLGLFYAVEGRFSDAMVWFKKALAINPKYCKCEIAYHDVEKWVSEEKDFETVLEDPPEWFADAHNRASLYFAQNGMDQEALDALNRGFLVRKDRADFLLNTGLMYEARGLLEQAAEALLESINLKVDSWKAYLTLSQIYTLMDRIKEAREVLEEGILQHPDYPDLHYHLAVLLVDEKQLQEAVAHLEKAIKINPSYTFAHFYLGTVFSHLGKYREAEQHLLNTVNLGLRDSQLYMDLARVRLNLGKTQEAESDALKAGDIEPDNPAPYEMLYQMYILTGDEEKAQLSLKEARRRAYKPES